jgi:hypothetical protein
VSFFSWFGFLFGDGFVSSVTSLPMVKDWGGVERSGKSEGEDGDCADFHLVSFTMRLSMAPLKRSSIVFPAAPIRSRMAPEPLPW